MHTQNQSKKDFKKKQNKPKKKELETRTVHIILTEH